MLNKEKYKDKIFEIACEGEMIAFNITTKEVCSCSEVICSNCLFHYGSGNCCTSECKKWGNSEYKEIRINWSKVPTDTPIYVNGKPKYFASYETDDKIYCFPNGTTSFTNNNESCESYSLFREDIELAKPEDVKKYLV